MEERGNGLFFCSGWQDFVKDNSLEIGDFLVFKYDGKSTFKVKIYGRNACEKEIKLAKKNNDYPISFTKKGKHVSKKRKKGKQVQEKTIIEEHEPDYYKESFGKKAINSNKRFCELNHILLFFF